MQAQSMHPVKLKTRFAGQYTIVPQANIAPEDLYASRALKTTYAPEVQRFLKMSPQAMVACYRKRYPEVKQDFLEQAIRYQPRYFRYGGADLFRVYNRHTQKTEMVLIEINSVPGGLSNTPELKNPVYQKFAHFFMETLGKTPFASKREGVLAVLSHGQRMDPLGIAQAIARKAKEPVHLITHEKDKPLHQQPWRVDASSGGLFIQTKDALWHKVRGAVSLLGPSSMFASQPLSVSQGVLIDPPMVHRAGGVEKARANEAYRAFNMEALHSQKAGSNPLIRTPKTYQVSREEVHALVNEMGSSAVVKLPDGNGGDGIWMLRHERDMAKFLKETEESATSTPSQKYIVQELILPMPWASLSKKPADRYNRGTVPDRQNMKRYVYDMRMLVAPLNGVWRPLGLLGRQAPTPIPTPDTISDKTSPQTIWNVLGTNLSRKSPQGWFFREQGLMVFDKKGYTPTGLTLDDLVEGYFQSIFAMQAIDKQLQWSLHLAPLASLDKDKKL